MTKITLVNKSLELVVVVLVGGRARDGGAIVSLADLVGT